MSGREQTVKELAAERRAERGEKQARSCSIPIWLVLIFLMTAAIAAIVVPLSFVFVGTSNRSINSLTETTSQLVLRSATSEVSKFLEATAETLENLVNSTYFDNDFTAAISTPGVGVRNSSTLIPAMAKSLNSQPFISAVVCAAPGQTAQGPAGPFTNRTNVQLISAVGIPGTTGKATIAIIGEPTTSPFLSMAMLNPSNYAILKETQMGPISVSGETDTALKNMLSASPATAAYFDITYINTTLSKFWQMSFYKNVWRSPENAGKSAPDFSCSVGSLVDSSISVVLNTIKPTANTVLMLLDEENLLLSTNRNNSIAANETSTAPRRVLPADSPNPDVAQVGKGILDVFGSYSKLPRGSAANAESTINQVKLADGKMWFLSSAGFAVRGQQFTLVVAFPRSDMFDALDKASILGIIIASSVSVGGVLLMALLTFLSLRPLHKMAQAMEQLTRFDFSSLENGGLKSRSPMTEIRHVENTFNEMVVGFATAIKKNRALAQGNSSASTHTKW
ncbi:hypothetical protein HDU96_010943 [Phlyctochytrium bullatum]|nr:hypothetical protein HDU96_010943 [Phlyctochytrium bullatum]